MLRLLTLARRFHSLTGGVFDPAVLPALEASGYDRSFELVERDSNARAGPRPERRSIAELKLESERGLQATRLTS